MLVLIFNAALHCPSMHALFTEHASKHYHYLRDTMPHLVPRLRPTITSGSNFGKEDKIDEEARRGKEFLEKVVTGVENARPGGRVHTQLLEAAAVDLDRLAKMDYHMEGAARFTALYIRSLLLLKSVLKEFSILSTNSVSTSPLPNTTTNVSVLLQNTQKYIKQHVCFCNIYTYIYGYLLIDNLYECYRLQRLFSGLDENEIILANDVWLKALAVELIRVTRSMTGRSALPLARHFLSEADILSQDPTKLPSFSRALVLQIPTLADVKPGSLTRMLLPLLLTPASQGEERLPRPSVFTRFCRAIIEEPRGDADAALKFTGGLLLGIPLTAKILNLRDPRMLRIKLRHPDQQVQLLLPRQSDLRLQNIEQNDYRLKTIVLLSHQVWMEACNVEISLALLVPSSAVCMHSPLDDPCVIDLCKPTKVSIAPKPIKRGI